MYYKRIPHEVVIIYQSVGFGVVTERGFSVTNLGNLGSIGAEGAEGPLWGPKAPQLV